MDYKSPAMILGRVVSGRVINERGINWLSPRPKS